jgi:hypothetical protein
MLFYRLRLSAAFILPLRSAVATHRAQPVLIISSHQGNPDLPESFSGRLVTSAFE